MPEFHRFLVISLIFAMTLWTTPGQAIAVIDTLSGWNSSSRYGSWG